ncbi:MAG: glycosyltransferase, partial [Herpetosiphonaceae bacterium]|nr:glycosyltransferase [Herpetosiphonaceae bacterium]
LLTYVPYTTLSEPFTINGMFYALRRDVLAQIGGFSGLESILADDFAVAMRLREHGYRLVQTPLRHAISTFVSGPQHYLSLLQRWFIFPRESLMRHLSLREQAILYGLGALPALFPLAIITRLALKRTPATLGYTAIYFGHSLLTFQQINRRYLSQATPMRYVWLVPLVEALFPLQLLAALISPQRIVWRGHVMQVERGGKFHFVRRRQ